MEAGELHGLEEIGFLEWRGDYVDSTELAISMGTAWRRVQDKDSYDKTRTRRHRTGES